MRVRAWGIPSEAVARNSTHSLWGHQAAAGQLPAVYLSGDLLLSFLLFIIGELQVRLIVLSLQDLVRIQEYCALPVHPESQQVWRESSSSVSCSEDGCPLGYRDAPTPSLPLEPDFSVLKH